MKVIEVVEGRVSQRLRSPTNGTCGAVCMESVKFIDLIGDHPTGQS